ncbi:hypothetical protein, partial [Burkholderia cenocepacia]|uniref:hypothetical protein n=1 Tax=Burkholderia cenocepacia TaxID=95486 RepID=UPI00406D40AD
MLPAIDVSTLSVATPLYLWLLLVPGGLVALWIWQLVRRRADASRLGRTRMLPVRQRCGLVGDLGFWLAVIVASALCILALAGPRARVSIMQRASTDVVVLLDGSASMYTHDVTP